MVETQVEIGSSCYLTKIEYGEYFASNISLDYTEHSIDPYLSDNETSLDINKEKAVEIIAFLKEAFDI